MSYNQNKEPAILRMKTGTTIVSVPFKEGYIIATDLRATNTSTLEVYTCNSKIEPHLADHFVVAGAGYSIGIQYCAAPVLDYLAEQCKTFHYNLDDEENLSRLKEFFGRCCIEFMNSDRVKPLHHQILDHSLFLVGFYGKKLVSTWVTNLAGDMERPSRTTTLNPHTRDHSEILGIGSGAKYARGYLCKLNQIISFKEIEFKEALENCISSINLASALDLGSCVLEGLSICVLKKNKAPELYKWLPKDADSWNFKNNGVFKALKKVNSYCLDYL